MMREKTPIAVRGKDDKKFKHMHTITISSELGFGKMNNQWKGLEEDKNLSTHNF
jgi:hypothetical protein